MKITARAEYASLAVLELALRKTGSPVQARELADSRGIPLKFLEQILIQLRNASIVRSVRGASGGYLLARPASEITLRDIVSAVEGESTADTKLEDRTLKAVWNDLQEDFVKRLDSISVQDLVSRKLRENQVVDFQI